MINVISVVFASSVNIGKENYEFTSLDTTRPEHRYKTMVYDPKTGLLWIIDRDPSLNTETLKNKRFSAIGTANIRTMRLEDVTTELKKHLSQKK